MHIIEVECEDVNWIHVAQERDALRLLDSQEFCSMESGVKGSIESSEMHADITFMVQQYGMPRFHTSYYA